MKLKTLKEISKPIWFLFAVILFYVILAFVDINLFFDGLHFFWKIFLKVLPIFILVFVLMSLTNYFVTPRFVKKHLGEKGIRKWFYVVVGGILSTGPIYMWYPLLADLKSKGLSSGLIACFLYNRAVKIPLLPLMVFYFSWRYVVVLTVVMIFFSIVQGLLIDRVMKR